MQSKRISVYKLDLISDISVLRSSYLFHLPVTGTMVKMISTPVSVCQGWIEYTPTHGQLYKPVDHFGILLVRIIQMVVRRPL